MDILLPPAGRGPGVLVAHPWWGLNQTLRDYGAALAREGFVVGLPDLFAGEVTTSIEVAQKQIRQHWKAAGPALAAALTGLAAHNAVTAPTLGAVGFSFGGYHLLAALKTRRLPMARLVTYYATHALPKRHAPVLAHFAADDDFESAADIEALAAALKAAGPPNASYSYARTKHWFAESDRPEYDAAAAKLAFTRTVAFLRG
ncbi:MAG: dienelactone hydrolase family protein [Devosia nanyangense]|uniref:Dienelactone hydrolase family protein n=1 Tax=Devosia nanyangense TaxID=1228055 RepID=A0A933L0Z7_9HYPH|nr:dienelactone hydrolase family protein [Devosia nanyangense]